MTRSCGKSLSLAPSWYQRRLRTAFSFFFMCINIHFYTLSARNIIERYVEVDGTCFHKIIE